MNILRFHYFLTMAFSAFFTAAAAPSAAAAAGPPNPAPASYEIGLHSRRFTPLPGISSEVKKALSEKGEIILKRGRGRIHTLIQLKNIPTPEERRELERRGIRLLSYIPNYAWLASIPASRPGEVSGTKSVRWVGELNAADKLSPKIRQGNLGRWAYDPETERAVILFRFFDDVELSEGEDLITGYGGKVVDRAEVINTLVAEIVKDRVGELAGEDIVEWIEQPLPPLVEVNDLNRERVGADTLQSPPYNLDGSGVDLLVYDGGIVYPHDDLDSRRTWGDSSFPSVHATHVAGTICGDGSVDFNYRGMAPAAHFLSLGFEDDDTGIFLYTNPGDIENDLYYARVEWPPSADLFNASIGTNTAWNNFPCSYEGNYGITSLLLDAIVRGGLGKPFIAAWAAGNERGGPCGSTYHTTAPPAGAKNPIQSGATAAVDDSMSSFSSWGPTDDGRLKPVICAPGVTVTSCNGSDSYVEMSGTSMATPTTAGIIALMLQQYRDTYFSGSTGVEFLPSSAKALLIHTAADLGKSGPDFQFGYGRIDGQAAVDAIINQELREFTFSRQSEAHEYTVTVPAGTSELKVSLAWDDPPGSLAAIKKLVNDLNLELVAPGATIYYPWVLNPDSPGDAADTGVDSTNNQEQVIVEDPAAGDWTVRVTAAVLPETPQAYSLVFPNAASVAATPSPVPASTPTPTPTPGYCFAALNNGGFESGENFWEKYGSFTASTDYSYSGDYSGRLGGTEDGFFYQEVALPGEATSARLSYRVRMETDDTSYRDFFDLEIRDGSGNLLTTLQSLCNTDADYESVWTEESFWLHPEYAGRTIRVQFRADGDSRDDTFWYVDDVSLEVCYPEGAPTPIPPPSPPPTPSPPPQSLPFSEDFEGAWLNGAPDGWKGEYVSGLKDWVQGVNGANGHPPSAHGGSYIAFFFERYGGETRLISPPLDLGSCLDPPRLSFWHAQVEWNGDIDTLTLLYCTSAGGSWTELTAYDTSVPKWTKRTLTLPDPSGDYYICFQARGNQGYGVCLDDVYVFCGITPTPTMTPPPTATPGGYHTPTPTPSGLVCALELEYSSYLGGGSSAVAMAIAVDSSGCPYLTGYSSATDFPTVNPYQPGRRGSNDVFVTRFSSSGSALVFSTYLGGSTSDYGYAIAVDQNNCAYLTGKTKSADFPTFNPFQSSLADDYDGFVVKLGSSGSSLLYSTYLGGKYDDAGYGVAVGSDFSISVAGLTDSTDFPTRQPYQSSKAGIADDIFAARLSSTGSSLLFSTYLGGANDDYALGIDVDATGNVYLGGVTGSYDFPLANPYQDEFAGGSSDAFVSKLSSTGSSLLFSTYLGGESGDGCNRLAAGSDESIFIAGYTASADFPTASAYQTSMGGGDVDAFITRFSSGGSEVIYSTYLGGDDQDVAYGIAINTENTASITGYTQSDNFPTRHPYQACRNGDGLDAFLAAFASSGGSLVYSTYWGGSDNDAAHAIGLDSDGRIYLVGKTASSDFPTRNPYQPSSGGGSTASFISSFNWQYYFTAPTATPTVTPSPTPTPSVTPSSTPEGYRTPTPTPSLPPDVTPSPSPSVTASPTPFLSYPLLDSGDYDGDGTDDIAVFRGTSGLWAIRGITRVYFGIGSDLPISGDYNGSNTTDIGIFRSSSGLWAIRNLTRSYFGSSSDLPAPGDYDGDGSCDTAVFRPASGLWAVRNTTRVYFGNSGDIPVAGDYDGDGGKEIAVFRRVSGLWALRGISRIYFGSSTDTAIPGDFSGDGSRKAAVFRPSSGLWAVRGLTRVYFGNSSDRPLPADYDGDSGDEIGVFRDSTGLWAVRGLTRLYYGTAGDVPVTR